MATNKAAAGVTSNDMDTPLHIAAKWDLDSVHISTPEKFQNADSFLKLRLPSTLIRHENGAFRKRSSNGSNLKTPYFRFHIDGKHFENGDF